jgi:hypothetical protein
LPFLIEDVTARDLRVPGGASWRHPNGVTGITCLDIVVTALDKASDAYERLLGVDASAPVADPLLAAAVVMLPCGRSRVQLASAPAGPIHEHLVRLGASPYALLLATEHERLGWLDPVLSHGAAIRLQPAEPAAG